MSSSGSAIGCYRGPKSAHGLGDTSHPAPRASCKSSPSSPGPPLGLALAKTTLGTPRWSVVAVLCSAGAGSLGPARGGKERWGPLAPSSRAAVAAGEAAGALQLPSMQHKCSVVHARALKQLPEPHREPCQGSSHVPPSTPHIPSTLWAGLCVLRGGPGCRQMLGLLSF